MVHFAWHAVVAHKNNATLSVAQSQQVSVVYVEQKLIPGARVGSDRVQSELT